MAAYAQQAADVGNLRAAQNRLTTAMPVASLTPERIQIVTDTLYPPRINPSRQTRQQHYLPDFRTSLTDHNFERALHKLNQGTAPGPFADSIDTLKAMGLHRSTTHPQANRPYFSTLKDLFALLLNNTVPTQVRPLLASIHFFALHKDLSKPDKLRPIGIGTGLRRTAATIALTTVADDIQPILTRHGQYGIHTGGGVDFAAHMTQTQINNFITTHLPKSTPSRALLLLDLTNMFNACSRTKCREILDSRDETKPLLPLFDLLYSTTTTNWYQNQHGNNATINQEEGFSQGCPLSPLFACLVLLTLTTQINRLLQQRATLRLRNNDPYDDSKGGISHTASVMDDTSICLPFPDLMPFLNAFADLGPPFGIHLNNSKCKILTSTTGSTPLPNLPPADRHHLQSALAFLNPADPTAAEVTTGIRFLGQPIGSADFVTSFLDAKLSNLERTTHALHALPNSQTKSLLFRSCVLPALSHLVTADVLRHIRLHGLPQHPQPSSTLWSSPFTTRLDKITIDFLQQLTKTQKIPTHALLIASLNSALGGLGYRCHRSSALPTLLNTVARTLAIASSPSIPPAHSHTFTTTPPAPHLPSLTTIHTHFASFFPPDCVPFDLTDPSLYPHDAQRQLTVYSQETHLLPLIVESTPLTLQRSLPSALSLWTSLALHQPRTLHQFRLPNQHFEIAVARKLRLAFLPLHYPRHCHCPRKALLDPYGDHFFSCTKQHKTKLSNKLRDAIFFLLQDIAPRSHIVRNESDIHLEPTNLLPHHPRNIRPADIGFPIQPPLPDNRFHYLAIDVTVPTPHPHLPPTALSDEQAQQGELPFDNIAADASQVHHSAARQKFTHDTITTSLINNNNLLLLPFSVDHLGGLGFFAHTILFGQPPWYSFSPSQAPSWTTPQLGRPSRCLPHPDAFLAYNNLCQHGPTNLLGKAQSSLPSSSAPFQMSFSHHSKLTLSHAITSALSQHVIDAFASIDLHLSQQRKLRRLQLSSPCTVCTSHRYFPHPFNPHCLYSSPDNPTTTSLV